MKVPGKIHLANTPTPLQWLSFNGCKFPIKRDDYTGFELSGNKVRKLEYLLARAVKEKSTYVYTCGGDQSNHSRATLIAAKTLGLKVKLFLWGKDTPSAKGNLFIDKFLGCQIRFLNRNEFADVDNIMSEEKLALEKTGEKVYVVPEGGSSTLGIWGYISFFEELNRQVDLKKIKGILTACGSGGTSAGLLIGAALNGLKLKIFAVNVLYDKKTIRKRILHLAYSCIEQFKIPCNIDENSLEILDGYSQEGYKSIKPDKISLIKSFASQSGIILDPAYTAKAFYAYNENFLKDKKMSNVLFIHTGGFFGIFNKTKEYLSV
ncbi:MAG: pyridoxal-phosphate dependent enzyme [Bacteroidota bacterium]|nr:pyridoxal-phosphate dependent enzyme [Bacteroidota bacterium]